MSCSWQTCQNFILFIDQLYSSTSAESGSGERVDYSSPRSETVTTEQKLHKYIGQDQCCVEGRCFQTKSSLSTVQ